MDGVLTLLLCISGIGFNGIVKDRFGSVPTTDKTDY